MSNITWEECARICTDPYRYHYMWWPLHDALGIVPGDRRPAAGLYCPEAAAIGWLSMARRYPQQRFHIPDSRSMSAPKGGVNWIG